jgi:hypothetical protein
VITKYIVCILLGTTGRYALAQQIEPQEVSVCAVIEGGDTWANRIVAVKGEFQKSRHSVYLMAPQCKKQLKTGTFTWPTAICLANAKDQLVAPAASFRSDWQSIVALAKTFDRLTELEPQSHIEAVIVGEIRNRPTLADAGPRVGAGFCSNGAFPLMLVVKAVKRSTIHEK